MFVCKTSHLEFSNGQKKKLNMRVGVKILRKIELSKNFTEILEPDDLQDISEDDTMIVL